LGDVLHREDDEQAPQGAGEKRGKGGREEEMIGSFDEIIKCIIVFVDLSASLRRRILFQEIASVVKKKKPASKRKKGSRMKSPPKKEVLAAERHAQPAISPEQRIAGMIGETRERLAGALPEHTIRQ
jgi:hypothetical protein